MFVLPLRPRRRWIHASLVVMLATTLTACSDAPSRNILGSYFPTWMICALGGIVGVAIVRGVLVKTGIDASMPLPVVVYLSMWMAITLAIWLIWLG